MSRSNSFFTAQKAIPSVLPLDCTTLKAIISMVLRVKPIERLTFQDDVDRRTVDE
jgi:hypothetical protein